MALNTTGKLSLGGSVTGESINLEAGNAATATVSLNDSALRTLAGKPSGQISVGDFYGATSNITSNYALFYRSKTEKYSYTSAVTVVATPSIVFLQESLVGAGNYSQGLFGGTDISFPYAGTTKYTYSSDAVVAGGNLGVELGRPMAAGNSTMAVFAGGYDKSVYSMTNRTDRYTYSSDTRAYGANLASVKYWGNATSTSSIGLFAMGNNGVSDSSTTDIHNFSANTNTVGTVLTIAANASGAAGNTTKGIFNHGGFNSGNDKYTYATNTVAAGGNLNVTRDFFAATGNSTVGIFAGGNGTEQSSSVYTYSTDTCVAGTALTHTWSHQAATSNPPGGF